MKGKDLSSSRAAKLLWASLLEFGRHRPAKKSEPLLSDRLGMPSLRRSVNYQPVLFCPISGRLVHAGDSGAFPPQIGA